MTPVGGLAALVVDRSPEPELSAADQDGAPTTSTLGGPVTLTGRSYRRAARSWVPTPASNPFATISTGASPSWSSKDGGRDVLIDLQTNNSFRVDRRMALRASLSLLSAVFNWRILGLSSSHRLQGETHA